VETKNLCEVPIDDFRLRAISAIEVCADSTTDPRADLQGLF